MLRFLIPACLFALVVGLSDLPYDFAIPRVLHPDLNAADFLEVPDNTTVPPGAMEFEDDMPEDETEISVMLERKSNEPLHTFRTSEWKLSDEDLAYAQKIFDNKPPHEHYWRLFNQDAIWPVIVSKGAEDTFKAFAFRRAVIDEKLIKKETNRVADSGSIKIDVFDDYQVVTECKSKKVGHSFDQVFVFRDQLHYAKFSYICSETKSEKVCTMSTIYDILDANQGWPNSKLDGMQLRTIGGGRATVVKWRNFWMCETGDFVAKLYPTLAQRLDTVGMKGFDTYYKENRNAWLAIRMFGLELLRPFRRQVPGFDEDMIADVEHEEHLLFKQQYFHPLLEADEELSDDTIG